MPKDQFRRIVDSKKERISVRGAGGGSGSGGGGGDFDPSTLVINTAAPLRINAAATGNLSNPANLTINVSSGLQVASNALSVKLHTASGLAIDGTTSGLTMVLPAVGVATVSASSTNAVTATGHTHTVAASDAPGLNSLIKTHSVDGGITLPILRVPIIDTIAGQDLTLTPDTGVVALAGGAAAFTLNTAALKNLAIAPGGNLIIDPVGKFALPQNNYDINLGMLSKKYLSLHAAELWVETLVAQNTIATIGGRILVGPTTTLTEDLPAAATTITVKHNQMTIGDGVYMEANGKVEFMRIASAYSGTGPYTYTVNRNLDSTGANDWFAGDAIFNTGKLNNGFIDLYSIRGVNPASTEYGPTIVGNVRTANVVNTTPGPATMFNAWEPRWAVGNLNGLYDYGANIYGFVAGKYAGPWIAVDATNGFRAMNGVETRLQIDVSGNLRIYQAGETDPTKATISLLNDGRAYIGNVLLIGQEGEIRQGTVWNGTTQVTDDGRDLVDDAGVLAARFNGTRIWQASSIGYIGGYRLGVNQWKVTNEGMLTAGGGAVQLQARGLTINQLTGISGAGDPLDVTQNAISWVVNPLNSDQPVANIHAGTAGGPEFGTTAYSFLKISLQNRESSPGVLRSPAEIEMAQSLTGVFLLFNEFDVISGIPGASFSRNPLTGVNSVVIGFGSGDFFTIATNVTTRVGGHWVPDPDASIQLGTSDYRWSALWVVDLHVSGTTYAPGDTVAETLYVESAIAMGAGGTVDGVVVSAFHADFSAHEANANAHHNQQHNLLGSDHVISGQTAGTYLRVSTPSTFGFSAILDADLPDTILRTTATIVAGMGLTGGGALTAGIVTLDVGAGHLIDVQANSVGLANASGAYKVLVSGATATPAWSDISSFAGAGMTATDGVLNVIGSSLISVAANSLTLADAPAGYSFLSSWSSVTPVWTTLSTIAGEGLTIASGVLAVVGGTLITVNADAVNISNAPNSYHVIVSGATAVPTWSPITNFAGAGMTATDGVLNVIGTVGGMLTVAANSVGFTPADDNYKFVRSNGSMATEWAYIYTLAGAGMSATDGVLNVGEQLGGMIVVGPNSIALQSAGYAHGMIHTNAAQEMEWMPISTLAGDGIAVNAGVLFIDSTGTILVDANTIDVNEAANYAWSGSHQFTNTVQIQNILTVRSIYPETTDTYDIGASHLMWRQSFISQMNAVVFAEMTAQLLGGWLVVPKYAGKTGAIGISTTVVDLGVPSGGVISNGDFILIRSHDTGGLIKAEYMTVVSNAGGNTWNVTRDTAGAHSPDDPAWADGTPYLLLGHSGDGRIELNAFDTPRISIISQGATYNAQVEHVRMGDVNGSWGYTGQTWGFAAGRYGVASNTWITEDATYGIRIGNNTVVVGRWKADGVLVLGETHVTTAVPANSRSRVEIDSTNGVQIIYRNAGGIDVPQFHVDVSGNAYIKGRFNIATTGDFWQGSGVPGASTAAIASWGTSYTGTRIGNIGGVGIMAGYNNSVAQWWVGTDGKFYTGAGNVLLDSSGISITAASIFAADRSIRFMRNTSVISSYINHEINSDWASTQIYVNRLSDGTTAFAAARGEFWLIAQHEESGALDATVNLQAASSNGHIASLRLNDISGAGVTNTATLSANYIYNRIDTNLGSNLSAAGFIVMQSVAAGHTPRIELQTAANVVGSVSMPGIGMRGLSWSYSNGMYVPSQATLAVAVQNVELMRFHYVDGVSVSANISVTGAATITGAIKAAYGYVDFVGQIPVTSSGWKRIAELNGSGARGALRLYLRKDGGDAAPFFMTIEIFTTNSHGTGQGHMRVWGAPNTVTGLRLTSDGTKKYVEVNYSGAMDSIYCHMDLSSWNNFGAALISTEVSGAGTVIITMNIPNAQYYCEYGRVGVNTGSAANPAYSFTDDSNTGMYIVSSDALGWSTGGTLAMQLSSVADLTVFGQIRSDVATGYSIFGPSAQVTIANNGTVNLGTVVTGLMILQNGSSGARALILINAAATVVWLESTAGHFSSTAGTASRTNVYVSGGNLIIQNMRGASQSYTATTIKY